MAIIEKGRLVCTQCIDPQWRCDFSEATLGRKEAFLELETSQEGRRQVVDTNKLIKVFCRKSTGLAIT